MRKICYCGIEFETPTPLSKYCSIRCLNRAYRNRRKIKVIATESQTRGRNPLDGLNVLNPTHEEMQIIVNTLRANPKLGVAIISGNVPLGWKVPADFSLAHPYDMAKGDVDETKLGLNHNDLDKP